MTSRKVVLPLPFGPTSARNGPTSCSVPFQTAESACLNAGEHGCAELPEIVVGAGPPFGDDSATRVLDSDMVSLCHGRKLVVSHVSQAEPLIDVALPAVTH